MSFATLDTLVVLIIIAVAAWYAFRKLVVRKDPGCGGCSGGCSCKGSGDPNQGCPSINNCPSSAEQPKHRL